MTLKTTKKNKRTARKKKPAPRVSRQPLQLSEQRNAKVLAKLLGLLKGEPVTSHQISKKMGCSNMVARRRIRQLRSCGYAIRVGARRVGERGPAARTYKLAPGGSAFLP